MTVSYIREYELSERRGKKSDFISGATAKTRSRRMNLNVDRWRFEEFFHERVKHLIKPLGICQWHCLGELTYFCDGEYLFQKYPRALRHSEMRALSQEYENGRRAQAYLIIVKHT